MKVIFQKLWPELAAHKKIIIAALILGIIVSALKALLPHLMNELVTAWKLNDQQKATIIPLIIPAVWILAAVARYFHLFWMKFTSDKVTVKLRRDLMDKYLSLNLAFYQSFVSGSAGLISRMLNDIRIIQDGIHKLADMIREPFLVVFSLGYLLYIDWTLTLFILVAVPLVTFVARRLARSLRKYSKLNQEKMEDLTKTLKESLDGARIVQSFNLENEMHNRFNQQAEEFLETRRKIVSREEASGPISESLASVAMAALLFYIGKQITQGHFEIADFVGFTFAIGLLQDSVKKVQGGYIKLQQAAIALERMHSVLDSQEVVPQPQNPQAFPQDWQEIEFNNVSFSYEDNEVLKDVNLKVARGEVIALVGSSGSGKSTLVNLLERFFDPNQGQIKIGGTDISQIDLKELRKNIALVSQDVFLFSDSIERNIWAGNLERAADGVSDAAKVANADEFISKTTEGYNTRLGDHGNRLSGGEKQRVSIARAIFKDAPILILDEATSALDSESEKEVQKGLDELMRGRTAFVIAHRLSTIMKADRIIVLKEGRIIEEGNHSQLMDKKGEYFNFQQLQSSL